MSGYFGIADGQIWVTLAFHIIRNHIPSFLDRIIAVFVKPSNFRSVGTHQIVLELTKLYLVYSPNCNLVLGSKI